jgi:GH35 family endo-1,4-beta-xylanase
MLSALMIAALTVLPQPQDLEAANRALLAEAPQRIEKYRKGELAVKVLDARGRPAADTEVRVRQKSHQFLFGAAAISLLRHTDPAREALYQQRFAELFNLGSVLTYWQNIQPEEGTTTLDLPDRQIERLRSMGIAVKGHPLILAGASPRWAPKDPDETKRLTEQHIRNLVSRYKGRVAFWDTVCDLPGAPRANTGLGAWIKRDGAVEFSRGPLEWAKQSDPDTRTVYNEYDLNDEWVRIAREITTAKLRLDVLGIQAHFVRRPFDLQTVWGPMERAAPIGLPIHYSELTVLSDDPAADHSTGWPTTPEGEARQAEQVEQLYTLIFSHPKATCIGWWNFVDGDWDRHPGGLLRADLTPKPAFERVKRLIHTTWKTNTTQRTDRRGETVIRGFGGRYEIEVRTRTGSHIAEAFLLEQKRASLTIRLK